MAAAAAPPRCSSACCGCLVAAEGDSCRTLHIFCFASVFVMIPELAPLPPHTPSPKQTRCLVRWLWDCAKPVGLTDEAAEDAAPLLPCIWSVCVSPSILQARHRLSLLEVSTCNFPQQIPPLMNCNNLRAFQKKSYAVMLCLNCILHRLLGSVQFLFFSISASVHPSSNYTVSHTAATAN